MSKYRVTYLGDGGVEVIEAASYSSNDMWTMFTDGNGIKSQIRTSKIERIDRDDQ